VTSFLAMSSPYPPPGLVEAHLATTKLGSSEAVL
jgi:hypothetical protein